MEEQHRLFLLRPREFKSLQNALLSAQAVLQTTLVEGDRRKGRKVRVHAVLDLQTDRPNTEADEPLEKTLVQAGLLRLLAHDDRAELAMVAYQNNVLGTFQDWNESFRLGGLRCLVNQHLLELVALEAEVERADAGCADDVRRLEDLVLGLALQVLEHALVPLAQELAAVFLSPLEQLLPAPEGTVLQVADLLVQAEVINGRVDRFARSGAEPHGLHSGAVDLLSQLIDGNIGRRTH